jgi:Recombination endonuclease VII
VAKPFILLEAKRRDVTPPLQATLDKYGLTQVEWLTLLADQGWICPICQKDKNRWNTDHEHVAGWVKMEPNERKRYVRGVLCWYCNHRRVNSLMPADEAQRIADYFKAYEARRDGTREPRCTGDPATCCQDPSCPQAHGHG